MIDTEILGMWSVCSRLEFQFEQAVSIRTASMLKRTSGYRSSRWIYRLRNTLLNEWGDELTVHGVLDRNS